MDARVAFTDPNIALEPDAGIDVEFLACRRQCPQRDSHTTMDYTSFGFAGP